MGGREGRGREGGREGGITLINKISCESNTYPSTYTSVDYVGQIMPDKFLILPNELEVIALQHYFLE